MPRERVTDVDSVRRNYKSWDGIVIVQGIVTEVLPSVTAETIAFLHLDIGYEAQGDALDATARNLGVCILRLPTRSGDDLEVMLPSAREC